MSNEEYNHIKKIINEVLDERRAKNNFILEEIWKEYMEYSYFQKEESTCVNDEIIFNRHIAPYFSGQAILDIQPKDIISWHYNMNKHLSYQTIVNNHKTFSKLYSWVDRVYNVSWNPLAKVGVPRKTEKKDELNIWSEHEFFHFFSVIDNLEHQIIFLLFYFCGFRRGELLALKWNDFTNNNLRIDESIANINGKQVLKAPKTFNSYRVVEIDNVTLIYLREYYNQSKKRTNYHDDNYIFGRITKPLAFETLRKLKLKYIEKAKVKNITIHGFRHSHVSLLINNHMPVIGIAHRIGDTVDEVLTTYAHLLPQTSLEISLFLNEITKKYRISSDAS
ncbi:MAG: tyrosine-type recombinase/integrase [Breznakia sp.]